MGSRVALVAIGLWTMTQAVLYGALAVAAAMAHRCAIDMTGSRFKHLIYTFYLHDSECGPIDWDLLMNQPVAPTYLPTMPAVTDVAQRTDILAIVYFTICCAWFLSSIGLLMSVCRCCSPKRTLVYTWATVSAAVAILDLVAFGLFTWDLIASLSLDSFQHHFQIAFPAEVSTDMPNYVLVMPSAVMVSVAARAVVFWIMNVVLLCLAVPLARQSVFKQLDDADGGYVDEAVEDGNAIHYSRNNNHGKKLPTGHDVDRFDDQAPRPIAAYGYGNNNGHNPAAAPITTTSTTPASAYQQQHQSPPPSGGSRVSGIADRRFYEPPHNGSGEPQRSASPVHYAQSSKIHQLQDHLLEQQLQPQMQRIHVGDRQHLRSSRVPSPPIDDAAAMRLAAHQSHDIGYRADPTPTSAIETGGASAPPAPPPEELRGQLPWSYFKSPSDISVPKRTFTQLRDDEDMPPVPVPDYTLHFPRRDRTSANNSSDEGAWVGPERRY